MKNEIALNTLDPSFRPLVEQFLAALEEAGIRVVITSARRTIAVQNRLYRQGRTEPGNVVTNAPGGSSPHNFGCAVDVCPMDDRGNLLWGSGNGTWAEIGRIGKQCGLVWGGDFRTLNDRPHFESPGWKTIQAAWKRGDIHVA